MHVKICHIRLGKLGIYFRRRWDKMMAKKRALKPNPTKGLIQGHEWDKG